MKTLSILLTMLVLVGTAAAQGRGPQTPGLNAAMVKLFGDTKAFSAKAEARVLDKNQKEVATLPMTLAVRDGKMRAEMDLSQAKGGDMPPEAAAMLKQVGMDRMVTLVLPEKKINAILYPGLQSYAEVAIPDEENLKDAVESAEVGKETIDGHPCKKMKLTTTDAKGNTQEAFVWQASDLKNFPIQIQMAQSSNTMIVRFQNPKLETPEAAQFDIPSGYTKYPNVQAMMQAAMMKMLGGQLK